MHACTSCVMQSAPIASTASQLACATTTVSRALSKDSYRVVIAALAAIVVIAVAAAPLQRYAQATARDLLEPAALVDQVRGTVPRPGPHQPAPETVR